MSDVFCKIINGDIPSAKIYEDEDVLAILDLSQATKGHTLVLSKKHFDNLLEIDDYDYLKVMATAKELAKAIVKTFNAKGVNILNNCGEAAGQTIMHFHVHIIPRYENDDLKIDFVDHQGKYDLNELKEEIVKNIEK